MACFAWAKTGVGGSGLRQGRVVTVRNEQCGAPLGCAMLAHNARIPEHRSTMGGVESRIRGTPYISKVQK